MLEVLAFVGDKLVVCAIVLFVAAVFFQESDA